MCQFLSTSFQTGTVNDNFFSTVQSMPDNEYFYYNTGDYSPRDEVQLKAPGDMSVFERLKGSLKDFLIRQITPQVCIRWCFVLILTKYFFLWLVDRLNKYG